MKAAVLHGIKNIRVEDIEKPKPLPDEALVKIKAVGVCGSDVHYYLHGKIGDQIALDRHILGHEAAGEVVEIGKNVTDVMPGLRVAIEPGVPCGNCEFCLTGRYNLCPTIRFLGTPPTTGAYCEFLSWPVKRLHPIPDTMTFVEGALVETMVVGMYAAELSEIRIGDDIAILGCGPIGISTLKVCKARGASRIFAVDLVHERLNTLKTCDNVIRINAARENPVQTIKKLTEGQGVDIVFEAAGSLETIKQSLETVKIGGKVIWIGIPSEDYISVNAHYARRKEVTIRPVRRFKHNYKRCIQAVESGYLAVSDLVTHRFKLNDISQAFNLLENYSDGVLKAIIEF